MGSQRRSAHPWRGQWRRGRGWRLWRRRGKLDRDNVCSDAHRHEAMQPCDALGISLEDSSCQLLLSGSAASIHDGGKHDSYGNCRKRKLASNADPQHIASGECARVYQAAAIARAGLGTYKEDVLHATGLQPLSGGRFDSRKLGHVGAPRKSKREGEAVPGRPRGSLWRRPPWRRWQRPRWW